MVELIINLLDLKDICNMKKTIKIPLIGFILLLLDLGLTIYFISNYGHIVDEGNRLANNSDFGYLVFALNFVYLIAIYFGARFISKYKTQVLPADNTLKYIKKIYSSDNYSFILVNLSFTFIVATFASRITVIIEWMLFGILKENFFNTDYAMIRSLMPFERFDVVVLFLAMIVAVPLWFYLEHVKSKKSLMELKELSKYINKGFYFRLNIWYN